MIESRRQMMHANIGAGGNINDYIQDGLIFMLDGIDKGTDDGNWIDLIGGMLFTNYGAVKTDSGFVFNGAEYMLGQSGVVYDSSIYTIEICMNPYIKGNWVLCTPSVNGYYEGFSVCISGNRIFYRKENSECYSYEAKGNVTISMNTSTCFCNFIKQSKGLKDIFSDRNVWVLGGRSGYPTPTTPRSLFNGEIYAVRIYNRTLNAEEMLNNQLIDNERFKLGL